MLHDQQINGDIVYVNPSREMSFENFLSSHSVKKDSGLQMTNTRIGDKASIYGGCYHIPEEKYNEFLTLYHKNVFLKNKSEYMTERQLDEDGPILIDMDFRYDYSVSQRIHTDTQISKIVCLYLEELKVMYQFETQTHIPVYVFEKDSVNRVDDKQITKDGIHIIIGLKSDRICQSILRNRILSKIGEVLKELPLTNTWEDVLDVGITKGVTSWQLYGSKKPHNEPYKLTYIYDVAKDATDDELMYTPVCTKSFLTSETLCKLSARYKNNVFLFMDNTFVDEYENHTNDKQKRTSSHKVNAGEGSNVLDIVNSEILKDRVTYFLESLQPKEFELREAYEYTMALPLSYYGIGSYTKWMRVGWALCNIDKRLLIVWLAMSSQQEGFVYQSICDLSERWKLFDTNNVNGLSLRSLMYWVREDNPVGFKTVQENSIDYHIEQTLERVTMTGCDKGGLTRGSGDYDIATVLYHLYKNEYVCASVKNNTWYRFDNHRWSEVDSGTCLRKSISEVLREIYFKKGKKLLSLSSKLPYDDDKTKFMKKKVDIITNICERLSKTNDKKNIMIESKELFYKSHFLEKLDQNPYLLCFNNGVIDFITNEFRTGRPEDYLSKCTRIDYIKIASKHSVIVDEINDFMTKLFPVAELHRYMWDHLASTLLGTCKEQTLNMYVGIGQNGKSVLVNLMEQVLGEYKGDVPLTLLTQQRTKVGGLSPELVQLKGVRYAVIQEPSKGDKINEGIMKQLTGGDPIQARSPYMTSTMTYVPQFKLVICSNEFMEISSTDHGTWRRVRVVDFEALFTEKPVIGDTTKPYQYVLDKDLKEKFKSWKEVFASLLVERAYVTGGNVADCDKVIASSRTFRESQDSVADFIGKRLCLKENACLSKMVIAEEFREWFSVNYGGKAPNMKDITVQIDRAFGPNHDGLWMGVQLKPLMTFPIDEPSSTTS